MRTGAFALAAICLAFLLPQSAGSAPPTGPSHCGSADVRSALVSFATALNQGDFLALDRLFAEKPDFQWYVTDGRIGAASKRRDTLIPYFRRRHRRGEQLALHRFQFVGNSPHWGNFQMTMRRQLPGVRGERFALAPGKGAAVCDDQGTRLIVMSFGARPG
jgi:hypothetical protein